MSALLLVLPLSCTAGAFDSRLLLVIQTVFASEQSDIAKSSTGFFDSAPRTVLAAVDGENDQVFSTAAECWLLSGCCWLLSTAAECWLLSGCCWLLSGCCWLLSGC